MSPIFIVGCGRSGTTLLRLILNRHSGIAIPEETWYYPQLMKELSTLKQGVNWRNRIANRVLELNRVHFPDLSVQALERTLEETDISDTANIIPVVNREFMVREGKPRWGDKTPGYILHFPLLKSLFPDAKVIHMVRDGRDVVPSILKYWSVGPQTNSFIETVFYWKNHVLSGVKSGPKYLGKRYMEVKYEDLVLYPEATLKRVCSFIEESFEPAMLINSDKNSLYTQEWEWHKETKKNINSDNIGKWKNTLNEYQIAVIEYVGHKIFKQFGYHSSKKRSFRAIGDVFLYRTKERSRQFILCLKVSIYKGIRRLRLL